MLYISQNSFRSRAEHPPARASLNFGFIIVRDYEFFVTQMCHKCKY